MSTSSTTSISGYRAGSTGGPRRAPAPAAARPKPILESLVTSRAAGAVTLAVAALAYVGTAPLPPGRDPAPIGWALALFTVDGCIGVGVAVLENAANIAEATNRGRFARAGLSAFVVLCPIFVAVSTSAAYSSFLLGSARATPPPPPAARPPCRPARSSRRPAPLARRLPLRCHSTSTPLRGCGPTSGFRN